MNNYINHAAKIRRNSQMGKSFAISEYCCQVPANRLGFEGNGGPFNLVQLKVIQECISYHVPGTKPALEPHPRLLPDYLRGLFGVYEVSE